MQYYYLIIVFKSCVGIRVMYQHKLYSIIILQAGNSPPSVTLAYN